VNGCEVKIVRSQVCCGALHAHAGDLAGARQLACQNIAAFEDESEISIITNGWWLRRMLASYGHLFAHDEEHADAAQRFSERIRDVSQQLAANGDKMWWQILNPAP